MKIKLEPAKVFKVFMAIITLLTLLNAVAVIIKSLFDNRFANFFFTLFNVNTENNIPSLYATLTLFMCAALLFTINAIEEKSWFAKWAFLGWIFLFLGFDENLELHERTMALLRERYSFSGIFYYAWVLPYGIAVLFLGVQYLSFLIQLPTKVRHHFIAAFVIFISGAVGMEMLGGRHDHLYGHDKILVLYYSIEEFLEMVGIAVFIKGLLHYISVSRALGKLKLKIVAPSIQASNALHNKP